MQQGYHWELDYPEAIHMSGRSELLPTSDQDANTQHNAKGTEDVGADSDRHAAGAETCLILLKGPSLSQQGHRSSLTRAAKQQRISQGCALHDFARPLVVSRELRANCEVRAALNQ
jgi:hypothetical protein